MEKNQAFQLILKTIMQGNQTPKVPLMEMDEEIIDLSYINYYGKVETRKLMIKLPKERKGQIPLVYYGHYDMTAMTVAINSYIKEGWAIAYPYQMPKDANVRLCTNDLVFNNACLYYLKNRNEFDKNKIAVCGGSAGGYMSLMLNSLHLGICGAVANCPITNIYFTFQYFFTGCDEINKKAKENTKEEDKTMLLNRIPVYLPFPFVEGAMADFGKIKDDFPDLNDIKRMEAFSPVSMSHCISNPVLTVQCTSDMFVPLEQLTKKYTYDKPGDTLPADFDLYKLPCFKGVLGKPYDETLDENDISYHYLKAEDVKGKLFFVPFEEEKRFNFTIIDEGPVECYAMHNYGYNGLVYSERLYLESVISRGASKTNVLSTEKLQLLLKRYIGKCIPLPTYENIDDSLYGSASVAKKEVIQELKMFAFINGIAAIDKVADGLESELKETYKEIRQQL